MVEFKLSREFFFLCFVVILGSFVFYNFVLENFILSFLGILFGVVYYAIYSFYVLKLNIKRLHSEIFIESTAVLSLFLFPMLAYGFMIFENMIQGIVILIVFSIMQLVNFVKNWTVGINHSKGFPIVLHGIFFPFTYFVTYFYAESFQEAVFILYFVLTGILSATNYKFINYQQTVFEDEFEDALNPGTVHSKEVEFEKPLISKKQIEEWDDSIKTNSDVEKLDEEIFNSIPKIEIKQIEEEFEDDFDEEDEQFLNSITKV